MCSRGFNSFNHCNPCTPCSPCEVFDRNGWDRHHNPNHGCLGPEPERCIQEKVECKCAPDNVSCLNYLVSDQDHTAPNTDPDLKNSWGLLTERNKLVVADNTTSVITAYTLYGEKLPLRANVFDINGALAGPTGIILNTLPWAFIISKACKRHPSLYLTATEAGTINGYSPEVDKFNTVVAVDNAPNNSVYKGLAIAFDKLYATDFFNGKIDVFDFNFRQLFNFPFTDPTTTNPLLPGFAPFNIVNINNLLYVTYALQDSAKHDDVAGVGNGFINVFRPDGSFVRRLVTQGLLNSPWGFISTDCYFGFPQKSFLVGNFGDGNLNAYDHHGNHLKTLTNQLGLTVAIPGLWGLAVNPSYLGKVFFASGPNDEADGLLGSLTDIAGLECLDVDCVTPPV